MNEMNDVQQYAIQRNKMFSLKEGWVGQKLSNTFLLVCLGLVNNSVVNEEATAQRRHHCEEADV